MSDKLKKIKNVRFLKGLKISPFKIVGLIIFVAYTISMLAMLAWGVFTALKTQAEFRLNHVGLPKGWPWEWEWHNIGYVFENFYILTNTATLANKKIGFAEMLFNTIWYAGGGAAIVTMTTCIMAYMTVNFDYKISRIITTGVIIVMMLPIIGAYPSEMQILKALGLYNTRIGPWVQKFNFLGLYFLVFQATFKSFSKEFTEAAYIDGASELQILLKIMIPLVRNTIFTIMILNFVALWNDYQAPLLYFPSYPTLAYGLDFVTKYGTNEMSTTPMRLSGAIIIMLPILVLFLIFKDRIIGNVSMGGVKE